MKKRLIWSVVAAVALAVICAGAVLAAQQPTVVRAGNLALTVNGGITPTNLPRHELAPIGFHASGDLATIDGSHPPALQEASFDVDKDFVVDVGGIPVCRKGQLDARSTKGAERACPGAILGHGSGSVEVAFPEQKPFEAVGPVLLFNGGEKGGATTFHLHTYIAIPAPTAVVVTGKVTRQDKGPYGLLIQATIPPIAGGSGSITHFELTASRHAAYEGDRYSFVFAKCADGRFQSRGTIVFADETRLSGALVRTCTVSD